MNDVKIKNGVVLVRNVKGSYSAFAYLAPGEKDSLREINGYKRKRGIYLS